MLDELFWPNKGPAQVTMKGKCVLITGGTGSFGNAVAKQLLGNECIRSARLQP